MAFVWQNVLVAPTGSSGLDSGDHTSVDEDPPWSDSDLAVETVPSGTSETAIFSGFNLSNAGGENEGYQIWARMRTSSATFNVTITVKQAGVALSTLPTFSVSNTASRTFVIEIPDADMAGEGNDDISLEFLLENTGGNSTFSFSWVRVSKSPFTTAQKAVLPSTLTGQDFVVHRASDLGVLGAVNGESVILWPDASGKGRHSLLRAGSATYQSSGPEGVAFTSGRLVGALGFDPTAGAEILWSGNKIYHAKVFPESVAVDGAVFSAPNVADFIGVVVPGHKHLLACDPDGWTLMSGDGSPESHLVGGLVTVDQSIRITEWVQTSAGNEHMWENDDASPTVDGSSGDNPFGYWSIGDRESDDRPYIGRVEEMWFIEATGITEASIDTARDEWVAGIGSGVTGTVAVTQADQTSSASGAITVAGSVAVTQANQTSTASGVLTITGTVAVVQQDQTSSTAGSAGLFRFTPPTITKRRTGPSRLMDFYDIANPGSVIIQGGVVSAVHNPDMSQIANADVGSGYNQRAVFLGGRTWTVSQAEKTILEAAGYLVEAA